MRLQYSSEPLIANVLGWARAERRPRKTILFYPQAPPYGCIEFKLCALLGYAITTDPDAPFDVAFKRMDATYFDPSTLDRVPVPRDRIVNGGSVDISKRRLDRTFEEVFGYGLEVDPTRHAGPLVEKANRNGAHDGRVLQGPIPPDRVRPDCVYQRLIDNCSDRPGWILDYRFPVYGDAIPLVYLKWRPVETRFALVNQRVHVGDPEAVLAPEERRKLVALARRMGLDYGEFDVLRDADGRGYVVDANNTPWGPPNHMPSREQRTAVPRLAEAFARFLEPWSAEPRAGTR